MSQVQECWNEYGRNIGASEEVLSKYWDIIQSRYGEHQRFYHTLNHIEEMLQYFDEVKEILQRPELVVMAIFFHDVVYEPTRPDNEELSAKLFAEFCSEIMKENTDKDRVCDWILKTKGHVTDVTMVTGQYGCLDEHYLLDMDLAILATSPSRYNGYAEEIRKEYCHFSEQEFSIRRSKVLKTFLERTNIFNTEHFRSKLETKARQNLADEIKTLDAACGGT
ncbi:uncharacterized protein LOC128214712 isoform X1 [Mya arenaria]|uniref:uncharacterized protein LOC128214712 isoform X1 n=1 Tax=Mya arenaria TaxID=6604 RepID=UPI0022E32A47|nr:uncharacterized protein LOC128214712 isoform X1 [Mya arenaria]